MRKHQKMSNHLIATAHHGKHDYRLTDTLSKQIHWQTAVLMHQMVNYHERQL